MAGKQTCDDQQSKSFNLYLYEAYPTSDLEVKSHRTEAVVFETVVRVGGAV